MTSNVSTPIMNDIIAKPTIPYVSVSSLYIVRCSGIAKWSFPALEVDQGLSSGLWQLQGTARPIEELCLRLSG